MYHFEKIFLGASALGQSGTHELIDLWQDIFEGHLLKDVTVRTQDVDAHFQHSVPAGNHKVVPELQQTLVDYHVFCVLFETVCEYRDKPGRRKQSRRESLLFEVIVQVGVHDVEQSIHLKEEKFNHR